MANVEELNIQIEAEAQCASKALDTLISKLGELQKSLGASLKIDGLKNVTSGMKSVQTSSDSMAKNVKASMSDANKTIADASKTMSKNLQESFNIPTNKMGEVKKAVTEMTTSLATNGRDNYGDYVENIAQELLKVASSGIKAENSMQGFYDTLKATGKIYINPVDLPTDWSKGLDGLLRQKITTDSSSGATSLDTYIQEWKNEFPEIFNDFNTDSVYDQFETLKGALAQFRSEASEPVQMPGLSDAVYESVVEGTNEIIHKFEDMSEASRDTAKEIGTHVQEIADKYADLGKDWTFTGSTDAMQKKVDSLTNSLADAEVEKEKLETQGKFDTAAYDSVIAKISQYRNQLENLKKQQAEVASGMSNTSSDDSWWDKVVVHGAGEAQRTLADFEEQLREADSILENGPTESGAWSYFPTRDLELSLETLQGMRPQFENEIDAYEDMIERFQMEIELSKEAEGSLGEIGTHGAEIPSDLLGTSGMTESVKETQAAITELSNSTVTLRERLANMFPGINGMHVYTEEYQNLQAEIDKTQKKIDDLTAKMEKRTATNPRFTGTSLYKQYQYDIEAATQKIQELEAEQAKLEADGGAKAWDFSPISAMLDGVISKTESWKASIESLYSKLSGVSNVVGKVTSAFAQLAFNPFGTVTKGVKTLTSRLKSLVPGLKSAQKATDGFNVSNIGLVKSLTRTTKMLALMIKRMALRAVISGAQEGFQNLALYCDECNASISLLMNSLNQLKNSFAAAVSPILNAFAPALNYVIQLIIKAVNYINQLLSALTGKSTWIKATELSEDYAAGLSDAADAAEDLKTTTLGIDELNINGGDDDTGSGSGSGAGTSAADMFTTEDIDSWILDLANKIKEIAAELFAPIKEAWEREGQFVIDSWTTALESVWSLIKAIGSDFLIMWQQEATVDIFANLFHIIGDIGLVVANLATNFEEAWSAADTGLHIFENIRDAIGAIVQNIRNAADYTVEWSKSLDFSPILTSIMNLTASLVPVVDNLSGVMTDFYQTVLLPLAKWSLEKGLPELIDVFTRFVNEVDWEGLRANLADLWSKLEPFAETVGEGVILFLERFLKLVKEVLNSQAFQDILDTFGNWLDSVDAEDVANTIQNLALAFVALKAVLAGAKIVTALSSISAPMVAIAGVAATLVGAVSLITEGFSAFGEVALAVGLAVTALVAIFVGGIPAGTAIMVAAIVGAVVNIAAVISENWEEIKAFFEGLPEKFLEFGSNIVEGLKEGIQATIADATQFVTQLFQPIIDAVKFLFGINSPSTVFSEFGTYMMEGLIQGIESMVGDVTEKFENIKETISGVWDSITEKTSTAWANVTSDLGEKWEGIKSTVSNAASNVKETVSEKWDSVTEKTSSAWNDATSALSNSWSSIESNATSTFTDVDASVSDSLNKTLATCSEIADEFEKVGEDMMLNLMAGIEASSSGISQTFTDIWLNVISPLLETLSEEMLTSITDSLTVMWEGILMPMIEYLSSMLVPTLELINAYLVNLLEVAITPLSTIITGKLYPALQQVYTMFNTNVIPVVTKASTTFQYFQNSVLMPLITYLTGTFLPTFKEVFLELDETIIEFEEILNELLEFLMGDFSNGWLEAWTNAYDIFYDMLSAMITYLSGEFTSSWNSAWNNIVNTYGNAWDTMYAKTVNAVNNIVSLLNNFISATESAGNAIANGLNSISVDIPDWVPIYGGLSYHPNVSGISLPKIASFETGGYPTSASLFWAGENGVAELLGTVGGRTAVASGEEITGIRDAVYDTGSEQSNLLQSAISLLQIIADKEWTTEIDGRELVNAYDTRKSRNGYSFTT